MRPEILAYYRRLGERTRLTAGAGRLEFVRTWDVLTRVLPPAPATVLDVGGATGVYAAPLAAAGYTVHVVDPVPEQVAEAAARPGVTASVGDARSLAEPDASVDAVLLLGPLYHLVDRADRIQAWREAARVVRPGGVVVAAVISRFASLLDGYARGYHDEPAFPPIVREVLDSGWHQPPDDVRWFTTAYFHRPEEVLGEAAQAGLTPGRLLAVEGPLWMIPNLDGLLADEARADLLVEHLRRIEAEPSLLGAASHLLATATRSTAPAGASAGAPAGASADRTECVVEPMGADHAEQVLAIYQAGIETGHATFQTTVPAWADWDAGHLPEHRYVAVEPDGRVLGWVALAAVSSRPVYAGVAELSIYVHPAARGRGVGRTLLGALIEAADAAGIWTLQTGIFPENVASVALHRNAGFTVVGRRDRIGRHHGVWRDVLLLERRSPAVG